MRSASWAVSDGSAQGVFDGRHGRGGECFVEEGDQVGLGELRHQFTFRLTTETRRRGEEIAMLNNGFGSRKIHKEARKVGSEEIKGNWFLVVVI